MFRNIKKNIIAIIIIVLPFLNINFVYGEENESINLMTKIEYEAEHNQTKIDNELEYELNEEGLFDEEINQLPKVITDLMEQGYEYSIDIGYFKEVTEPAVTEPSLKEMTDAEIDELIGEQYEDEIRKEEKVSSIEKVFGIKDVYASDVVSEDTKNADGGTIKQAVILTYTGKKISGCKEVLVYCVSTWITPPRNRGYDVTGVTLKNLTPYEGVNAYYYVTEYDHSNPGRVIERLCNVKCEHKENENGMAVYFNLEDDKSYAYYKNHKIVFYFYALVDNELQKHVTASGHYYHKTSHLNVTPGISIGYDSITVCVSVSTSTKVTELPLNVKSTMIFK